VYRALATRMLRAFGPVHVGLYRLFRGRLVGHIAFFTFVFTRRPAEPERRGPPRSQLPSDPADKAKSHSVPDWVAIVFAGIGVVLIAGVVLLLLVIYIGLAGCVPVVGSAVGAPCD
jgi:hypothetical protein